MPTVSQNSAHAPYLDSGAESFRIDSVVDEFDSLPRIAEVSDVIDEGPGVHHDARGAVVQPLFDSFEGAKDDPALELAEFDDRFWPEIPPLQHKGSPL